MPLSLPTLDRHLVRLTGELPVTFSIPEWGPESFSGSRSTPTFSQTLLVGGFDQQVAEDLFVRKAALPAIPAEGLIVVINQKHYKILRVRPSPDNEQLLNLALGWARQDLSTQ